MIESIEAMDTSQSDNRAAPRKAVSAPRLRECREAKLDEQLRKLYEAYGDGKMPEEVGKLAEALARKRASLAGSKSLCSDEGKGDES